MPLFLRQYFQAVLDDLDTKILGVDSSSTGLIIADKDLEMGPSGLAELNRADFQSVGILAADR